MGELASNRIRHRKVTETTKFAMAKALTRHGIYLIHIAYGPDRDGPRWSEVRRW